MRWQRSRRSSNVEDYRGQRFGRTGAKVGIGGALVLLAAAWLLGVDPGTLLGLTQSVPTGSRPEPQTGIPQDEQGEFISAVLGETEDTWSALFAAANETYEPPTLVLFSDQVQSTCGFASAATGPFYCPADRRIYIDLAFYDELNARFGAPGDFAQAYVLAHEVGHHVQTLLGTSAQVRNAQQHASELQGNQLQVRMELQADCYAGVWAYHADRSRQILEQGDLDEALVAAAAVGDDTLQKQAQGYVVPESFTHGTAEERASWFRRGFETGAVESCDTFAQPQQASE